eukprot:SAG31_NODE_9306_length_1300_cov_9.258118_1_plen_152_part_10
MTTFVPSGLKAAEFTLSLWPSNVCSHSPVTALQIRTSPGLFESNGSPLAVTTFVPSGLKAAEFTPELWSSNVCSHSPVTALQNRTVLSPLAVTTFVPSGLKAAEFTLSLWPSNVRSHSPVTILIRAPVGKIDRQSIDADGSNSTEKAYEGYW